METGGPRPDRKQKGLAWISQTQAGRPLQVSEAAIPHRRRDHLLPCAPARAQNERRRNVQTNRRHLSEVIGFEAKHGRGGVLRQGLGPADEINRWRRFRVLAGLARRWAEIQPLPPTD